MYIRLFALALLCALPAHAVSDFYKDKVGDLKVDEPAFQCLDISSVKVVTADRKTFNFEVKTKSAINVGPKESPYFIVAVNLDGNLATGNSAWTSGQDFCAFIDLEGSTIKATRTQGDATIISAVSIEENTLRFTLTYDATRQRRMTFNIRSMIRRPSSEGKAPYTVLDSSVPTGEAFHELKL